MKTRVLTVGALTAALMAVGGQAGASANVVWCLYDPPIKVVSPAGQNLMVNNMVYLSVADRRTGASVTDDAVAAPDGHGGTLVTVHMYVPAGISSAFVVSSVNRYQVTSSASAGGGQVITFRLDLPTS